MSELYYDIKIISDYLSKSLQKGRLIFNKQYINTATEFDKLLIENNLFRVYYNKNECIEDQIIKIKEFLYFSYNDIENTFISKHFIKDNSEYNILEYDEYNYYIDTQGSIPYRWLLMIKDFYWKNSTVEKLEKNDYLELINKLPQITFEQILNNSHRIKSQSQYYFEINSINKDKEWFTIDGKFSPYAKLILENLNNYSSLKSNSKNNYKPLYAYEGGILIENKFIADYTKFNHNYPYSGSIRNEVKGNKLYRTGKDVINEELLCLYLALKDNNVMVSEFKKK